MTTNETALREVLEEAKRQLEYLDSRWPTGTTPTVISRINIILQSPSQPVVAVGQIEAAAKAHCDFFGGQGWWDSGLIADTKPKALEAMRTALAAAHAQASPPPVQGEVTITREMLDFLCGSGPLEGYHFGEANPNERGAFWWRKRIMALAHSQPDTQEGGTPLLDALTQDKQEREA